MNGDDQGPGPVAVQRKQAPGPDLTGLLARARAAAEKGVAAPDLDAYVHEESGGAVGSFADLETQANKPSMAGGIARSAAQGATLDFADEIAGLIHASIPKPGQMGRAIDARKRMLAGQGPGDDYPDNPGALYRQGRDEFRSSDKAFRESNPKTAFAANLAGGLSTALIPGAAAARGAKATSIGRALLEAAATGAATGGTAAVGASEKPGLESLEDAKWGALVGGVAAPIITGLGRGGVAGAKWAKNRLNPEAASTDAAEKELANVFGGRPGGFDEARKTAAEMEAARPGQAVVADLTPEGQGALDFAVTESQRVRRDAQNKLLPREAGTSRRLARDVEEVSGFHAPVNVRESVAAIDDELADVGRRAYGPLEEAYPAIDKAGRARGNATGQFVDRAHANEVREFLDRPIINTAYRSAHALAEMVDPKAGYPGLKQLQNVREKLFGAAGRAAAAGDANGARPFYEAAQQLTDLMEKGVPGYKAANAKYAEVALVREGMENGPGLWGMEVRDARAYLNDLAARVRRAAETAGKADGLTGQALTDRMNAASKRAVDGYRYGAADKILVDLREMLTNKDAAAKYIHAGDDFKDLLRIALPGDAELLKRAGVEGTFRHTAKVGGGSPTTGRIAMRESVSGGNEAGDVGANLATGGIVGATTTAVRSVLKGTPKKFLPKVAEKMGTPLLTGGKEGIEAVIQRLEAVQAGLKKSIGRNAGVRAAAASVVGEEAGAATSRP